MDRDILIALNKVIDPELGINIVDLGLICRAAHVSDGIEVALGMTSPVCPLGEMMVEEATRVLRKYFPDASPIHVELIRDFKWSAERMTEEGRRQLGLS
jgi:metal-sulfur cluster biosynthetic enzyme